MTSTDQNTEDTQIVKLDVGGIRHETYCGTLKESPYFKNLIEGGMANSKLVNGHVFIDRSGALFSHVLQYLRTRKVFAEDKTLLLQLKMEAEFFQLNQLGDAIQQRLDMLESEGKEVFRFMNLRELDCVHLNKPVTTSSTTLSSAVQTHQQETFKVINVVDSYSNTCATHNRTNCGCNFINVTIRNEPKILVTKRKTSFS